MTFLPGEAAYSPPLEESAAARRVRAKGMSQAMTHPLRAASVAWYVTGRFYTAPDKTTQDLGYFLHLQGISGALFHGPPSEQTGFLHLPVSAVQGPPRHQW